MSKTNLLTGKKKCQTCRFFFPEIDREDSWGECHRFPPSPFLSSKEDTQIRIAHWPEVRKGDLCGEWKEYIE
jgi:hypothetical protein